MLVKPQNGQRSDVRAIAKLQTASAAAAITRTATGGTFHSHPIAHNGEHDDLRCHCVDIPDGLTKEQVREHLRSCGASARDVRDALDLVG